VGTPGELRAVGGPSGAGALVIADDWPGAWSHLHFTRPADWREVAGELAWDLAAVCAAWVHLEAAHQDPVRMRSLRDRADLVADLLRRDLPFLLDVGPSTPAGHDQPQLPLLYADEPALERLSERPEELSWRTYFALPLHLRSELILSRARVHLRARWLADRRGPVPMDPSEVADDTAFATRLRTTFGPTASGDDVARWCTARDAEDRALVDRVGAQVALQVECVLREQDATVLPLVEEGLALHLEDAALGAALHVATAGDVVTGLCLVSHDGRPRSVLPATGDRGTDLRGLVAGVAT
jgi:hypothetical protein